MAPCCRTLLAFISAAFGFGCCCQCWAVRRSERYHQCSIPEYSGLLICRATPEIRQQTFRAFPDSIPHKFDIPMVNSRLA
ncbi:hypothetical protein GGX14DRAFT_448618, partial [Mycena pura]